MLGQRFGSSYGVPRLYLGTGCSGVGGYPGFRSWGGAGARSRVCCGDAGRLIPVSTPSVSPNCDDLAGLLGLGQSSLRNDMKARSVSST